MNLPPTIVASSLMRKEDDNRASASIGNGSTPPPSSSWYREPSRDGTNLASAPFLVTWGYGSCRGEGESKWGKGVKVRLRIWVEGKVSRLRCESKGEGKWVK